MQAYDKEIGDLGFHTVVVFHDRSNSNRQQDYESKLITAKSLVTYC